jgi:hypothetical protein
MTGLALIIIPVNIFVLGYTWGYSSILELDMANNRNVGVLI